MVEIPRFEDWGRALRILKKYPNRRIYDSVESRYITLEDVRVLVRKRTPLQVVDSKSGADLTRGTLLQIITEQEQEGHGHLLTNQLLEELIRLYDHKMGGVLSAWLETSLATFLAHQRRFQDMTAILPKTPMDIFGELAGQQAAFLDLLFNQKKE